MRHCLKSSTAPSESQLGVVLFNGKEIEMEARALYMNAMEVKKANGVKVVPFVNDTYKENKRMESELQRMEIEYEEEKHARRCRAIREMKDDLMCVISGISLVVSMVAVGLMCAAFL